VSKESTELLEALLAGDAPRFHPNTGQNLAEDGSLKLSPSARAGLEAPRYCQLCGRRLEEGVEAGVRHLGLTHYGVIGHSDGGIVALRLAADPTNPVTHIIPIGAQWELPPDDPAPAEAHA